MEREAPDILYGLEKFHHYCFAHGTLQEGHSYPHTLAPKNPAVYQSIQHKDLV